ncbi:MAG: ATP-binding protein [Acidimicrobiales bacterium]
MGLVADTIGARQQPGMALDNAIAGFLEHRSALLILDNCEHVIAAARGLARRLIEVDGLVVLATSRHVLGVRGEHVYPVEPLDRTGGAVELFVDRARDRDPRFELNDDTESAVIEICHRLDGMPLAIELAAARTGALSPRAIAARLDDRFRLLRRGRDGGRAHTLRDTVQWSYELLSAPEAALFERLAVFAGTFDLAAVEAVCADGDVVDELDVLDPLANLVDQSMVQRVRGSDDRFRLLETLRQFAVEQLAERGGADQLRDHHADYFARYVADLDRQIFGPGETEAWAAFDADWDNTRVAVLHHLQGGQHQRAADMICDAFVYVLLIAFRDRRLGGEGARRCRPPRGAHLVAGPRRASVDCVDERRHGYGDHPIRNRGRSGNGRAGVLVPRHCGVHPPRRPGQSRQRRRSARLFAQDERPGCGVRRHCRRVVRCRRRQRHRRSRQTDATGV